MKGELCKPWFACWILQDKGMRVCVCVYTLLLSKNRWWFWQTNCTLSRWCVGQFVVFVSVANQRNSIEWDFTFTHHALLMNWHWECNRTKPKWWNALKMARSTRPPNQSPRYNPSSLAIIRGFVRNSSLWEKSVPETIKCATVAKKWRTCYVIRSEWGSHNGGWDKVFVVNKVLTD